MAKKATKRAAPMKTCPACGKEVHARAKICPHCQAEQPVKEKVAGQGGAKKGDNAAVKPLLAVGQLASEFGGLEKLIEAAEKIEAAGGAKAVLERAEALQFVRKMDI